MRRTALAQLLDQYHGETSQEEGFRERMRRLLEGQGDPFARSNWRPGHFTCSSFVLSPDLDSLLLIFHRRLDRWLQPGGHVEAEDVDMFAAARREVLEETGVDGLQLANGAKLFDLDIHQIPGRVDEPAHEHFDLRFLFVAPGLEATAGSDAVKLRWVGLAEVAAIESDASVMRAVEKLQRRAALGAQA